MHGEEFLACVQTHQPSVPTNLDVSSDEPVGCRVEGSAHLDVTIRMNCALATLEEWEQLGGERL